VRESNYAQHHGPISAGRAPEGGQARDNPLSPAQAKALLDNARAMDDRWSALYVLAVTTSLRQGELPDLRRNDEENSAKFAKEDSKYAIVRTHMTFQLRAA